MVGGDARRRGHRVVLGRDAITTRVEMRNPSSGADDDVDDSDAPVAPVTVARRAMSTGRPST